MADPAYYESHSLSIQIHQKKHRFTLYLREGDGETKNILGGDAASNFGYMGVVDWAIYNGLGEGAKLVARARGQRLGVGSTTGGAMLNCFSLNFVDERFRKSSLKVLGEIGDEEGECAIIGGTGEFAYAQGVVVFKKDYVSGSRATKLNVCALCSALSPTDPQPVDYTTIDSSAGSTVVTSTDPTGQGDRASGHDKSLATPSSKGAASELNFGSAINKNNKKRPSTDTAVGEPSSKRPEPESKPETRLIKSLSFD